MDAFTTPLPKTWQKVRLGDIFFITAGGDLSKPHYSNTKQSDFNYPIYSNAIEKKGLYGYSSFFIIKNKSITITARGTMGVAFFRDYPYVPIGRLLVLQPKISNIDCRFYTEYINSKVKFNTEQTTIPQLTIPKVALCEIPLPPLNEQIAIANILSALDRYLCSLDALILKKESVKKALRIKMLNQILASNGVEFRKLGDIILSLKTGLNPRSFFKLNTPNANNYYVTVRELEEYTIKFTHQTDRIDDNALSLCLKRSNLEKDDILFSGTGTIGKVSIIEKNPNNWAIKEGIYSIKPNKKIVFPRFLMFCFESSNIQNDIKNKSFGGTVKSIPMNDLQQIQIPLPPLNEQAAIANILSDVDSEITSLKNKKRQFENIKKALNHDLMSAKIRVLKK
ncbi:restriction endonuclease subunit S [Helicobacter pylori]|nr:restriction endonuclease subunit S [Helicobacter pylori]